MHHPKCFKILIVDGTVIHNDTINVVQRWRSNDYDKKYHQ